jgi:ferredoxin
MGIDNVKAIGSSTDCTRCGKCIEACHKGVIGYRMWPAKSDTEAPKGPI